VSKWEKLKNKLYILPRKAQGETPLTRKGNKRLNKRTTNGIQSQKNELPILDTF
jgi:hypothetical protein